MTKLRSLFLLLLVGTSLQAHDSTTQFFVFLDPNPGRPPLGFDTIKEFQAAHLVAMDQMYQEKKLSLTGPFVDSTGGEIFVVNAASEESALKSLEADPLVRANRFVVGITAFTPIAGSICEPPELYDLVRYPFVRLMPKASCTDEMRARQTTYYETLAQQKKVVFAARMETDGSLVVVFAQNELIAPAMQLVKSDPAVRAGAMRYSVRPWTTSRDIFCDFTP